MIHCRQCQMTLEPEYEFCPRCGLAMGNPLLAPNPAECVHERHGALSFCVKCGSPVFGDETYERRQENTKWAVLAGVCALVAFVLFFLSNPGRISPDMDPEKLGSMRRVAQAMFMGGIGAIVGVVVCVFKMKLFGERDV